MKRTGFARKAPPRPERRAPTPVTRWCQVESLAGPAAPVPKDVRDLLPGDEARLAAHVRSLPCQAAGCGAVGSTEASHSNALTDGKGRGLKAHPWRLAALCHACHARCDQGSDLEKHDRRAFWLDAHHNTIGELFSRGLVRPV